MPIEPKFTLTARIATDLMRIERAKQAVVHQPITAAALSALREPEFPHATPQRPQRSRTTAAHP